MSPGLTSRPSLSGSPHQRPPPATRGVAGINLPAFVERRPCRRPCCPRSCVAGINLPAFVERASAAEPSASAAPVSPGLTSRPSLSEGGTAPQSKEIACVAGINLPAFVERSNLAQVLKKLPCVAGINLPAFVERPCPDPPRPALQWVSPGLTSRPSLSDCRAAGGAGVRVVSPGLTSRPSLSGHRLDACPLRRPVSPGLTSRPSLSDCQTSNREAEIVKCRRD